MLSERRLWSALGCIGLVGILAGCSDDGAGTGGPAGSGGAVGSTGADSTSGAEAGTGADVGSGSGGAGGDGNGGLPAQVTIQGQIQGSVQGDASSIRLEAAETKQAADDGSFSILADVEDGVAIVRAAGEGLAPQLLRVVVKPGVTDYRAAVAMVTLEERNVEAGGDTDIELESMGRGVMVRLPAGAVDAASGVHLRAATYDYRQGPGALLSADGALQSAGMFYVDVVDADGEPVDLGDPIEIVQAPLELPEIPDAENLMAWQLGDDGQWMDPQPMPPAGQGGSISADQFGFWNADRNFRTACVRGKLSTPGGACSGQQVRADGPDGISSTDSSGADGEYCVLGAQTWSSNIVIGSSSTTVQMPADAGDCGAPETCAEVDIEISEAQCDEPPVGGSGEVGDPCDGPQDCVPGSACVNQFCVGEGALRVSLLFSVTSDLDLHLLTPSGSEIYYGLRTADGGTLDVDQCAGSCEGGDHVENIVFPSAPPAGTYQVWVVNYSGAAGGAFTLEVAGAAEGDFSGSLPAQSGATSEFFSFQVE